MTLSTILVLNKVFAEIQINEELKFAVCGMKYQTKKFDKPNQSDNYK
jgi:hypothetical protein